MAPRAAARLETLGFTRVYEYTPGKVDWLAAGLRAVGTETTAPTVEDVIRADVPRFKPDDRLDSIAGRLHASGQDWGAIVDDGGVLLGRIRVDRIADHDDPGQPVAEVMEEGPATYRPNVPLQELLDRMREKEFGQAFVTDPDGKLLGLITQEDIEARLQNPPLPNPPPEGGGDSDRVLRVLRAVL
jgi:CBS domain-containing protein